MSIEQALWVFGITDINSISYDDINKKYKYLVVKNHPDNGGSTNDIVVINTARDLIIKYKDKKTCRKNRIDLEEFIRLREEGVVFKGKIVEFGLNISLRDNSGIVVEEKDIAYFSGNSNEKEFKINVKFSSNIFIEGNKYILTVDMNGNKNEVEISNSNVIVRTYVGDVILNMFINITK